MKVYVSPFEHNAVTRTLHHLSNKFTISILELSFDKKSFSFDLDAINEQFISNKPDMVIVNHASNVYGIVAPILEITHMAKSFGAVTIIDMCQTMGLIDTDLSTDDIDYAIFAGHKTLYAPFGVAGFIGKPEPLLTPLIYGGTGIDSANPELPATVPERYEVASPNIQAIAGLNASLHWIGKVGIESIFKKEQANRDRLITLLKQYKNIHIIVEGNDENNIGVVSAVFDGFSSDNIGQILSDKNIAVRTGLHCAPTAHKLIGTYPSGSVRFSVSYFNNDKDFEMLKNALEYIYVNS
jgi:selenocysteine lyase/cysteine desulfurase